MRSGGSLSLQNYASQSGRGGATVDSVGQGMWGGQHIYSGQNGDSEEQHTYREQIEPHEEWIHGGSAHISWGD